MNSHHRILSSCLPFLSRSFIGPLFCPPVCLVFGSTLLPSFFGLFFGPLYCPLFLARFLGPPFCPPFSPRFWVRSIALFYFGLCLGPLYCPLFLARFWARPFALLFGSFLGPFFCPPFFPRFWARFFALLFLFFPFFDPFCSHPSFFIFCLLRFGLSFGYPKGASRGLTEKR